MSTQLNTITSEHLRALVAPIESDSSPNTIKADDGKSETHRALRIAGILQTTLEIDQVIELFSAQIKATVHHTAIFFRNDELGVAVRFGRNAAQACSYQLMINDASLGELTLARAKPFTETEIKALEFTLCALIYPLRNALLYKKALHAAHKDPLTGVNNRSTLNDTLRREIDLARRHKKPLSLIVLDIDHFKAINDTMGHSAGDFVIKALAERTSACIRSSDILFRYGGEEFVIVLSDTALSGAALLAERIRKAVEKTQCGYDEQSIRITVSLGVAALNNEEDERALFKRADQALYLAKANGRNCVELAEDVSAEMPKPCPVP